MVLAFESTVASHTKDNHYNVVHAVGSKNSQRERALEVKVD